MSPLQVEARPVQIEDLGCNAAGSSRVVAARDSYVCSLSWLELEKVPASLPLSWHVGERRYVMPAIPALLDRLRSAVARPLSPHKEIV